MNPTCNQDGRAKTLLPCQNTGLGGTPPLSQCRKSGIRRLLLPLLLAYGLNGFGQEPEIDPSQLPRIPPTEPADALATFEIRPGFELKLVAHEPNIVDPIAMAFDAEGGMYVIEMRGYSERREEALGRIRYLQDEDGDGLFESSTVFKDGLKWPTGIVCYDGGVFVGASPNLFYFKDTDGDRVSDEEKLLFTGFGEGKPELNMQALFNSFRWGPDNRIWGATASNGGTVRRPDDPNFEPISVRGADFSFDPKTLDFRTENGTAQYGMSFDSHGRRFVCSNSAHAVWVAYEREHVLPSPYYDLPPALINIPDDGAAAPVFRISPDEPWRIVRTRWRVSGVVRGMIEGGGRVSGYFTSATGIHIYWGGAYGDAFQNNIIVGDVGSNLVHRKVLVDRPGRVQPLATRSTDELDTEFLRSSDNWFRPASFATGPDGCLYICDMYREVIEHPWSLPQGIKKHLDLNSGFDRGRIYRIEPEGYERPTIPKLTEASDAKLALMARHGEDDWHRTTARRLLFQRGIPQDPNPPQSPFPALLSSEDSLLDHLSKWEGDPWLEATILNSLRNEAAILAAWKHPSLNTAPKLEDALAKLSGRSGIQEVLETAVAYITNYPLSHRTVQLLSALRDGIYYRGGNWEAIETLNTLSHYFEEAVNVAQDSDAVEGDRLTALSLLDLKSSERDESFRKQIVNDERSSDQLISAAIRGIQDIAFLLDRFDDLPPQARAEITTRLTQSPTDAHQLLRAIDQTVVSLEQVSADAIQQLRDHRDPSVAERAATVLPKVESRSEVLARYQVALSEAGDVEKGAAAFNKACITCHRTPDGQGYVFGPATATFKTAGKDSILSNIIDPNKEVAPQYQAFEFELTDGKTYVAMIASEDPRNITLVLPGGIRETFPRTRVKSMTGLRRSLMPEGLEQTLSTEEMTDLLAYLTE